MQDMVLLILKVKQILGFYGNLWDLIFVCWLKGSALSEGKARNYTASSQMVEIWIYATKHTFTF